MKVIGPVRGNVTSIQSNQWHHVALTLNGGSTVTNNALKLFWMGHLQ